MGSFNARNSSGNNSVEYFVAAEASTGATHFAERSSANASDGQTTVVNDDNEFGDFYRIDFVNNVIHVVWADNDSDIWQSGQRQDVEHHRPSITLSRAAWWRGWRHGTTVSNRICRNGCRRRCHGAVGEHDDQRC